MVDKQINERLPKKAQKLGKKSISRKKIEESLDRKNTELNSFINNIPDMAWLKDKDSRFIAVNKAFCDAAGTEWF